MVSSNINNKIHYYGWNRIQENIQSLNITNKITIIDYVDIYFLSHDINIIDTDWIGIVHHTTSTFSNNNITNLFRNNIFLNSLKKCKALIVLSEYNRINILKELNNFNLKIKIIVFKHPIPPTFDKIFNINSFEQNLNIYNIGGWLRNPYTIFHSNIHYNNKPLNKFKLKGYSMDQYFPNKNIDYTNIVNKIINKNINDINDINSNIIIDEILQYSHPNNSNNYYIKYLIEYIYSIIKNYSINELIDKLISNHNSVIIQDYLENECYLDLLVSNIVFCEYIDCSASNTIVECISTGTPIVINKHPAIVEYLGEDYPLYFNKIYNKKTNIYNLNSENILHAHEYLLDVRNNTELQLDYFLNKLNDNFEQKPIVKPHRRRNNYYYNRNY
jgi:hypothetical protein